MIRKTTTKKIVATGSAVVFALTLAACSQQNPLTDKNKSKKEVAKFLINDSAESALKTKFATKRDDAPYAYRECMNGKVSGEKCTALYKEMVLYAHGKKGYENLSLSDLTDSAMWKSIRDEYLAELFTFM